VPGGIVRLSIDPATGLKAYPDQKDAMEEVFLSGTEPTEVASPDAGAPETADAGAAEAGAAPAAAADGGLDLVKSGQSKPDGAGAPSDHENEAPPF
jgi:penicillin-binding protein 1A